MTAKRLEGEQQRHSRPIAMVMASKIVTVGMAMAVSATLLLLAFIQRKSLAHSDIEFAHMYSFL
jgi:uncharacterized PurR-regulated membrane protein YhhQ (DUF165 family)